MVDVGDSALVEWALGQNGKTVVLTVTDPVGVTSTPSVTETTGTYSATVPTTQAGRHTLRWTTSGASHSDIINVWPADPRYIISFDEAVKALRWRPADVTAHGEDLRLHIASATEILEDIAGAVLVRTVEHHADGGSTAVLLSERPASVTSVEVDGTAVTDYVVDERAAIVYAGSDPEATFAAGRQNVTVTYTTGAATVSPSLIDAARILVRHMVAVEQSPNPTPVDGGEVSRTPTGFMVPNRVLELVTNRRPLPGIA